MKEIKLFLIRRNYGWGSYGSWRLVAIDENEDLYEELAKKDDIKVEDSSIPLSLEINSRYDIREIDANRLASLAR